MDPSGPSRPRGNEAAPGAAPAAASRTRAHVSLPDDGYLWLKYGEKHLVNPKRTRIYFKCGALKELKCTARKFVDFDTENPEDAPPVISYRNSHTHPRPQLITLAAQGEASQVTSVPLMPAPPQRAPQVGGNERGALPAFSLGVSQPRVQPSTLPSLAQSGLALRMGVGNQSATQIQDAKVLPHAQSFEIGQERAPDSPSRVLAQDSTALTQSQAQEGSLHWPSLRGSGGREHEASAHGLESMEVQGFGLPGRATEEVESRSMSCRPRAAMHQAGTSTGVLVGQKRSLQIDEGAVEVQKAKVEPQEEPQEQLRPLETLGHHSSTWHWRLGLSTQDQSEQPAEQATLAEHLELRQEGGVGGLERDAPALPGMRSKEAWDSEPSQPRPVSVQSIASEGTWLNIEGAGTPYEGAQRFHYGLLAEQQVDAAPQGHVASPRDSTAGQNLLRVSHGSDSGSALAISLSQTKTESAETTVMGTWLEDSSLWHEGDSLPQAPPGSHSSGGGAGFAHEWDLNEEGPGEP